MYESLALVRWYFAAVIGVLVFANLGEPDSEGGVWWTVFAAKWVVTGIFLAVLAFTIIKWFDKTNRLHPDGHGYLRVAQSPGT